MTRHAGLKDRIQTLDASLTMPLTLSPGRGFAQTVALGLAHSGDSFIWAGLCLLAWFLGNAQWKTRAVIVFAGLVIAEIAVIAIKMCIRRPRPPGRQAGSTGGQTRSPSRPDMPRAPQCSSSFPSCSGPGEPRSG